MSAIAFDSRPPVEPGRATDVRKEVRNVCFKR